MTQINDKILISSLDTELVKYILRKNPTLSKAAKISYADLLNYRFLYLNQLLAEEIKTTEEFNKEFNSKLKEKKIATKNLNDMVKKNTTFGQRMADKIAKYAGSWPFIIVFLLFLVGWMYLNATGVLFKPFDRYPFILLNLALSCLAAIQAPVIMMSQNRQALRDRAAADNDYETNMKSELEISLLHEKMDYLMSTKWEHIIELQQLQIELLAHLQDVPLSPEVEEAIKYSQEAAANAAKTTDGVEESNAESSE